MKKLMFFFVLFALCTSTTFAQKGQGKKMGTKDHVAATSKILAEAGFALSDRQTAQLSEVYTAQKAAIQEARATGDKSKLGEIKKESREKVSRILSAEQNQVMADVIKEKKEARKNGTGGYKPMPGGKGGKGHAHDGKRKDRFERIKKGLANSGQPLTSEQTAKIDMIRKAMDQELEKVGTTYKDDTAQQKARRKIHKTYLRQAHNVLTEEQVEVLKSKREAKKEGKKKKKKKTK